MRDHEHAGFSWYLTNKSDVFNPYNVSDRVSRKTWYDNVTYPEIAKEELRIKINLTKPIENKKKPHTHNELNSLFTRLNCPECNKRKD